MAAHKHFDRITAWAVAAALLIALAFWGAGALGLSGAGHHAGYETRLFDTGRVHTIDIAMDDWDGFIDRCTDEQYALCSLTIDGESYPNVAIRAKGNTSMSSVAQLRSSRYSFKIEFDHYDDTLSYHGLDKLNLNNGIFDNSYMKDYLVYQMMNDFGVPAPLSSFAWITVNGEPWGLYLALEGVEDGFLRRNYGSAPGVLYKPDGLGWGGNEDASGEMTGGFFDTDAIARALEQTIASLAPTPAPSPAPTPAPADENNAASGEASAEPSFEPPSPGGPSGGPGGGGPGGFGMGNSDVRLRYIDDDPASYPNIFNSAKTAVTDEDKARLIASLKDLTSCENLDEALDMDAVLRYFVVHNFVCNGDSYTGGLVHNYYLHEQNGHLSMIPWDYNLAFGTFQSDDAQGEVNDPIDTPGDTSGSGDRPMIDWIFSSEEYTALYHEYFAQFINEWFTGGKLDTLLDETMSLIAPYVAVDPSAFCTLEEFGVGVSTLRQFCTLRAESVAGQLNGSIPSTKQGQRADSSTLIDTTGLELSAMGKMGGGPAPDRGSNEPPQPSASNEPPQPNANASGETPVSPAPAPSGETAADASVNASAEPAPPASDNTTASAVPSPTPATSGEVSDASGETTTSGEADRPSGEMPQPPSGEWPQERQSSELWLLLSCLLVLAAALVFARRFRRRKH